MFHQHQEHIQWLVVSLGGSFAKGTADGFSDADICIVCPLNQHKLVLDRFLECGIELEDSESLFGYQLTALQIEDLNVDMRLITDNRCEQLIADFEDEKDYTNRIQDFLWNLCNGVVVYSIGDFPKYDVQMKQSTRDKVLKKFVNLFRLENLYKSYQRADVLQQWEEKLIIAKILVSIGYASKSQLFKGFKHVVQLKQNMPVVVRNCLALLEDTNDINYGSNLQKLESEFQNLKASCASEFNE